MIAASLTLNDGRKIGVPKHGVYCIANVANTPVPGMEKGKTLVRFLSARGPRLIAVKDSYKHVLTLFPLAMGRLGWAHVTATDGCDLAIPDKSGVGYEELPEKKGFSVTLDLPGGAMDVSLDADLAAVEALMAPEQPPPPEAPAEAPAEDEAPAEPPVEPSPPSRLPDPTPRGSRRKRPT